MRGRREARCGRGRIARGLWSFALLAQLLFAGPVRGVGPEDFSAWIEPPLAAGIQGETVGVSLLLGFRVAGVQGWSLGICTVDPEVAVPVFAEASEFCSTVKDGGPADFISVQIAGDGVLEGIVVAFFQDTTVPATPRAEVLRILYELRGTPSGEIPCDEPGGLETAVELCDTLSEPPVTSCVVVDGVTYPIGSREGGTIRVCQGSPIRFGLEFQPQESGIVADEVDEAALAVAVSLDDAAGLGPTLHALGWRIGIGHDPDLIEPVSVMNSPAVLALNGGAGPDFVDVDLTYSGRSAGVVVDVIVNTGSSPVESLEVGEGESVELVRLAYRSVITLRERDGEVPITTGVWTSSRVGSPSLSASIVFQEGDGRRVSPARRGAAGLVLVPIPMSRFTRGDANGDDRVDVADAVTILRYLFESGYEPGCLDAADANDDERIQIVDPIAILLALFDMGWQLVPYPECGPDLDGESLGCAHPNCP